MSFGYSKQEIYRYGSDHGSGRVLQRSVLRSIDLSIDHLTSDRYRAGRGYIYVSQVAYAAI